MDTVEIDWDDHPLLKELDEFISTSFSKQAGDYLIESGYKRCICIQDVKITMRHIAEDMIQLYNELLDKIEYLPDDTQSTYLFDEDEI